ncbi:hypothetical protein EUGRSUZ_H00521 [Eucalyptus grandis]|uniref:Uncharacterized protein n=2 Tax=Eucalyptus grandis TaxID=71139 RepID=A0ACC3JLI9_EUCGR|nr:hypothetical protein EUGRSUZ_H00521 [Eucalyptus grandis]
MILLVCAGLPLEFRIKKNKVKEGCFLMGRIISCRPSITKSRETFVLESDHVEVKSNHNPFLFSGTKVGNGYAQMLVTSVSMNTTWGKMMSSINRDDIINSIVGIIATAVTIVGVTIPEGLPLTVTLTLAYSIKRMMADQAMVRKLLACETMGSTTTICADKTGTLTMNQMKVMKLWIGKDSVAENPSSGSEYEFSGSPTEKAILSWAVSQLSMDVEEIKKRCEVIQVEAFNSEKKRSGVLIKKSVDDTFHVHWKGAVEMVLAMCSSFYNRSGIEKDLDKNERKKFKEDMKKIQEDSLTLLGLVGIKDPCRPGVRSAVQACRDAGVNIKMITGDNTFTAKAIAAECVILRPGDNAFNGAIVEGAEFRNYTSEERFQRVEKIRIMARSSPFDKLLMVQCLKQKSHVVGVIGDGTSDAPALKEADIGLSMSIQGTEIAKESSDIVILDDNFASVATVLRWGQCLTVNVVALVINFVAVVSSGDVPLTAVQLLWVNLIMDTLGTLALATEWPTKELMEKPPVGRMEPLITNVMWRNLVAQATYQMAVLLTLQFKGEAIFGVDEMVKRTLIFNAFILCQVFNEFNARKLEKKNGGSPTQRLSWGQWSACIGIVAASWPIGWAVKCIPVPDTPIFSYLGSKSTKLTRKIMHGEQ